MGATGSGILPRLRGDPHDPSTDLRPAVGAGVILLGIGAALSALGGAVFGGAPTTTSLWVALVGVLVFLAAIVLSLLRAPAPAPRGVPSVTPEVATPARAPTVEPTVLSSARPPARPRAVPMARPGAATSAVRRAVALAADAPAPSRSGAAPAPSGPATTSIPAAYLQSLPSNRGERSPWGEVAPPIAAALPFAAVPRAPEGMPGLGASRGETDDAHNPSLELEMARLRARVRELEARRPPVFSSSPARPTAPTSTVEAPEPPAPPVRTGVTAIARGCIGCGTALTAGQAPLLCWGCGRALCSTCYWRYGAGPGLHRCPDCFAQAPSAPASVSGGRAAIGSDGRVSPSVATAPPAPSAPSR